MARPFEFKSMTQSQARFRQQGQCACCGEELDDLEEHAHHVVPNQSGDPLNHQHAWIRSAENCVVLCAVCHERVHENGKYRVGAVAPPSYFPFSHGGNTIAHELWVAQMNQNTGTIWPVVK